MLRKKLRKLRKEKGISQTFLSNALGYKHPSGYSNIEHGRIDLSLGHAKIIADILGCTTDDLAEEEKIFFDQELHKTAKSTA